MPSQHQPALAERRLICCIAGCGDLTNMDPPPPELFIHLRWVVMYLIFWLLQCRLSLEQRQICWSCFLEGRTWIPTRGWIAASDACWQLKRPIEQTCVFVYISGSSKHRTNIVIKRFCVPTNYDLANTYLKANSCQNKVFLRPLKSCRSRYKL